MDFSVHGKSHKVPKTRWNQIPNMLQNERIDALVATSPENVTYTSGHYECTRHTIFDRITATVIPAVGDAIYLVADVFEPAARRYSWISQIAAYRENADSPIRALATVLQEKGLASGVIAVENEHLTAGYFEELKGYLPKAQFRDASIILAKARSVKTLEEISFIEAAAKAIETAHLKVYRTLKPGDTEAAIARRVHIQHLIEGADATLHAFAEAGRNSMESGHHIPDETPIRLGDVVNVDTGARFGGYVSDISRIFVVGKPTARQKSLWRRLREVQRKGIESVRAGVKAGEAFTRLRQLPENQDIVFYGHSIGVYSHDAPMLLPYHPGGMRTATNIGTTWDLEPNMLVFVEFALVDRQGGQTYHFEDLVHVTERGQRIITDVMDTTDMFVVE